MSRSKRRFGWVLVGALCGALVMLPGYSVATEQDDSSKEDKKPAKESPLVKASREVGAKKTGVATTYSNEDLKEGEAPKAKVYTNDDLSRMYGASEEPAATDSGATATPGTARPADMPDPLALMEQQQKDQAAKQKEIAEAEAALSAAQARLKNLEVQLLATRNPFSARPELSEEEQEIRAEGGESAAERAERTQKLVDEAKEAVAKAESDLRRVRGY